MSKKITASNVKLKRAYERPAAGDGTRILIDRLWPRGVKKVNAAIDQWAKDIAPSTTLRKWFDHVPAGRNFAAATRRRSTSTLNSSRDYVPWQDKARSRSYSRLTMRFITTPLH
jgi:uncharacterized protein YeaO (DUF488 family)